MKIARLKPGTKVSVGGRSARIDAIEGFDDILVRFSDDGSIVSVKRWDVLSPVDKAANAGNLETFGDADLKKAQAIVGKLAPILSAERPTAALYEAVSKELGVSRWTVYRMVRRYRESGKTSAVLPSKPNGGRGKPRTDSRLEAIMSATIEEHYLTRRRPSVIATYREMEKRCRNAGLTPPSYNTLRNRIGAGDAYQRISKRNGAKVAAALMRPIRGSTPGADHPLSMLQMDHYRSDIEIVDERYRKPIGRPWLTVAIDVYSRMIAGIHLSLDDPGASSAGLCMINAILPKETYLSDLKIDAKWPVWGVPRKLHLDNAKEFRGVMMERACTEFGTELQFRPVRTPHYGGHIERIIGTFAKRLRELPGATFSNPQDRGEGNPGGSPVFTLRELERYLVTLITKVYHLSKHSGIGTSPIEQWQSWFFDDEGQRHALPEQVADERALRLAFMPALQRSVQRYGIQIDHIHYYSDALRHLIPAPTDKKVKQYLIRRDPRDISRIYLFDPGINEYLEVPYRDLTRPAMSKWELVRIVGSLEQKKAEINENAIFDALEELRAVEVAAANETKRARRDASRRESHRRAAPLSPGKVRPSKPAQSSPSLLESGPVEPFEDLEIQ